MKVYIFGVTPPYELVSRKMDSKWRTRYVDYKFSPKDEGITRVKIMSFNGRCDVRSVKLFKDPNK